VSGNASSERLRAWAERLESARVVAKTTVEEDEIVDTIAREMRLAAEEEENSRAILLDILEAEVVLGGNREAERRYVQMTQPAEERDELLEAYTHAAQDLCDANSELVRLRQQLADIFAGQQAWLSEHNLSGRQRLLGGRSWPCKLESAMPETRCAHVTCRPGARPVAP
jgi:hypothetical protein